MVPHLYAAVHPVKARLYHNTSKIRSFRGRVGVRIPIRGACRALIHSVQSVCTCMYSKGGGTLRNIVCRWLTSARKKVAECSYRSCEPSRCASSMKDTNVSTRRVTPCCMWSPVLLLYRLLSRPIFALRRDLLLSSRGRRSTIRACSCGSTTLSRVSSLKRL